MGDFYIFPLLTKVSPNFNIFFPFSEVDIFFFLADGFAAACVDVLQITHAAISMVKLFSLDLHRSSAAAFVH